MQIFQRLMQYHGVTLLLAGMGMTLGFAPFNLWPVTLASLAYWVWAVREASGVKQALTASFLWGIGWQLTSLYWLPRAFYLDADRSWVAGIFGGIPALFIVALWGVLGVLAGAYVCKNVHLRYSRGAYQIVLPLVWVAVEVLKGLHPMGFPWLPLGAMWANWPWLAQGASVAGVWGLSYVLVGFAVVLADRRRVGVFWVAGLVLLLGVAGAWRMETGEKAEALAYKGRVMPTVRLVQPNEQSALKWDPEYRWHYLRGVEDLTFGRYWQSVDAFILPENAVPFYLEQEPGARAMMTRMLLPNQVLATGTLGLDEGPTEAQDHYYNRLSVLGAGSARGDPGSVLEHSAKVLLVPFGEYIPLRWVLDYLPIPGVRTLSQSRLDYTAGVTPHLLDVGKAGRALPLVCYEAIFAPYVAAHSKGADFLLNVTNDNWFTGTIALSQHAALTRLRAIETGLPLVRVANTGITVVYDGYGREVARLPVNTAIVRDVRLPGKILGGTFWTHLWAH